jgi:hypothetical protein
MNRGMNRQPDPSMTPKEEEEFLLLYGPKKVRKAIKERRAREQAQERSKGLNN